MGNRLESILAALTQKTRAERVTFIAGALVGAMLFADIMFSNGLLNWQGLWVGGDFLAFYTAGKMAWAGQGVGAYDVASFEAALQNQQAFEAYGLTWQYPPTAYFLVMPFALLPYKLGFALWMASGLGVLGSALRALGLKPSFLLLALASPLVLVSLIQGQNSLFFGALLMLALGLPDKRPLLAGLAAGLLTLKPHLGLLIPLAFLAGGYWRSFGAAALTALILAALASLFFGVESWSAFADSLQRVGVNVAAQGGLYPFARMISLYSALGHAGVPANIAMAAHLIFVALLGLLVLFIWRQKLPLAIKAAITIPATLLVPPYGYYYEMVALLYPVMVLVQYRFDAKARGFLILAWPLVLYLPSIQPMVPLQIGFAITLGLLVLMLNIARQNLKSANAMSPPQSGSQRADPVRAPDGKPA
jgi:glycosyl transferase family 87